MRAADSSHTGRGPRVGALRYLSLSLVTDRSGPTPGRLGQPGSEPVTKSHDSYPPSHMSNRA